MALLRDYTPQNMGLQDRRGYQSTQLSGADTRALTPYGGAQSRTSWVSGMLADLVKGAMPLAKEYDDQQKQEAYLAGAMKAGVVNSEKELETSFFTKDWTVAGYRDTMGKMALADAEASFQRDAPKLRERDPAALQEYLDARRKQLMPTLSGMSREARKASVGQILQLDRAATKKYTTERAKFIIEQKSSAIHTQWSTAVASLSTTQTQLLTGAATEADYTEQLRSAATTMIGSVWMDNSLPLAVQQQLTTDMLQNALNSDAVGLYEFMRGQLVQQTGRRPESTIGGVTGEEGLPGGDMPSASILSRLTADQQTSLATNYREAMSRTGDIRNLYRMEQLASIEASIDANKFNGTYGELNSTLSSMVINKTITGGKRQQVLETYLKKKYKEEETSDLAGRLMQGDIVGILNSDKTVKDSVDAMDNLLARNNASTEQRISTWFTVASNGTAVGYKKAGELLNNSFHQLAQSVDNTVLPQNKSAFETANAALKKAESLGYTNTREVLLSGMSEDNRMFAERMFRWVDEGASFEEALQRSRAALAIDSKLPQVARIAMAQGNATKIRAAVDQLDSQGYASRLWSQLKGVVSAESAAEATIQPLSTISGAHGYVGDTAPIREQVRIVREAVLEEAADVAVLHPTATPEEVVTKAKVNVAARSISTRHGPIPLPKGIDLQQTFGVEPGNQAAIGTAIDTMLKNTVPDSTFWVSFQQGRLLYQEYDRDGNQVGTGNYIEPKEIRERILKDTQAKVEEANARYGTGKTVVKNGVNLKYNGENSAGIQTSWMLAFRDNLVEFEGVEATPYTDLSGNRDRQGRPIKTVGVGVSSSNPARYPAEYGHSGRVPDEAIQSSFIGASDDAAKTGRLVARSYDMDNKAGILLMSELAYQSGAPFMTRKDSVGSAYRAFAEALRSRNVEEAQRLFKKTAAWRYSGIGSGESRRQKHYLDLIEQAVLD